MIIFAEELKPHIMIRFSEYVSLGHPDKIADYISQYILDRYIERDPDTRYAVEVQIKNYRVTLGGEVSSKAKFTPSEIRDFAKSAVNDIGYNRAYLNRWGAENTICGDLLDVESLITHQSPDIALGVDNEGWGDQGIFFGYCNTSPFTNGMPYEHDVAKLICRTLFDEGIGGLDIKAQAISEDGRLRKMIVAIPLLDDKLTRSVKNIVKHTVQGRYDIIVNGTGRYVSHSSIADCGTTGRKLAVDFYGGECKIGGGSPWTKDASKADLSLNLFARDLAKRKSLEYHCGVRTSLACCIGKKEVEYLVQDFADNVLEEGKLAVTHSELRKKYHLDTPIYASMCRWGLFGRYQQNKAWENIIL